LRFTSFLVQTGFEMTGFIGVETGVPGMPALLHIVEEADSQRSFGVRKEKRKKRDCHVTQRFETYR
jgi:hypothetical protein